MLAFIVGAAVCVGPSDAIKDDLIRKIDKTTSLSVDEREQTRRLLEAHFNCDFKAEEARAKDNARLKAYLERLRKQAEELKRLEDQKKSKKTV